MPSTPDQPDTPTPTADPLGVERQRAKLDRLGDLALEFVEILMVRARKATDDADLQPIALAVARVSRVVRLTCALHVKLAQTAQAIEKEQRALDSNQRWRNTCDRSAAVSARNKIITRVMARIAIRDEGLDEQEALETLRDWRERLDDETFVDLLDRPVSELIAEFCRSLDLTPDWEALATEAWAQKEIEGGDVGAPLAAIAERMVVPRAAPSLVRAASP